MRISRNFVKHSSLRHFSEEFRKTISGVLRSKAAPLSYVFIFLNEKAHSLILKLERLRANDRLEFYMKNGLSIGSRLKLTLKHCKFA